MNDIKKAAIHWLNCERENYSKDSVYYQFMSIAISALEEKSNGGWIPFKTEYNEDYNMDMLQGKIPEEEEEILVSDGKYVWQDTFMRDGTECYLDSGTNLIDKVIAWQSLPPVYKEVGNE